MVLLDLFQRLPGWPRRARGARRSGSPAGLSRRDFELLAGKAFRAQGYQVTPMQRTTDGIDLVLRRDRQTHLVRCEQSDKVGVDTATQLHRLMTSRGAEGGVIVTSGRFGREAVAFATGCNIRLIDGTALLAIVGKGRPGAAPDADAAQR
jgi:restriction system protein